MPYKRSYKTKRYRRRRAARTRKRRYLARRRRARALSYRRRRRKYARTARITNIFPRRKLVSLRWYNHIDDATLNQKYIVAANNPRDPTSSSSVGWEVDNHQVYGWDQMTSHGSGMYQQYVCIGSRIRIRVARQGLIYGSSKVADTNVLTNGSGNIDVAAIVPHRYEPYPIGGWIEDPDTIQREPTSFDQFVEYPHVKYKVMNARQQSKTLTMKWGYKKEASKGIISDNRWVNSVGNNPTELRDYCFKYVQLGGSQDADQPFDIHVTIDYLVLFSDPKDFVTSEL